MEGTEENPDESRTYGAFVLFNKITVQPLRHVFSSSLSLLLPVSKTRGSPRLLPQLRRGEGGIRVGQKGSLQEFFSGRAGSQLPCALWSVAYENWEMCMLERGALHTGGMWPKFNLSIVRMEG